MDIFLEVSKRLSSKMKQTERVLNVECRV